MKFISLQLVLVKIIVWVLLLLGSFYILDSFNSSVDLNTPQRESYYNMLIRTCGYQCRPFGSSKGSVYSRDCISWSSLAQTGATINLLFHQIGSSFHMLAMAISGTGHGDNSYGEVMTYTWNIFSAFGSISILVWSTFSIATLDIACGLYQYVLTHHRLTS